MLTKEYPEVTKVVGELKKLSLGERLRMLADEREKRRKDFRAMKRYIREEALEEGREEGIVLGMEKVRAEADQEKLEVARKLKAVGLSVEFIAESLKLPLETVEGL
jgi:predicted transposase/invertase (TIGR01784 family)